LDTATLIVSPDAAERAAYGGWLRSEGYRVVEAESAAQAIAEHHRRSFPLTLAELISPAIDGVELIHAVRAINPRAELLMLSSGGSVHAAVAAMKAGAVDLLLKPIDRETLLGSIRQIGGLHEVLQENRRLREEIWRRHDFSRIIAHSPQMLHVLSLAGRVAPRDTSVLITGESGTGKELLARAIHVNSARAHRPLVSINCAAIPEALIESELFGYKRGAFTGAHADKPGLFTTAAGGTLLLDEVADLPLPTQAKLLRFLQDGTYFPLGGLRALSTDVRVIAATNAPLRARVEDGTFRRDLYYRLSVFPLHIPPLRERPDDIVPLAHHFLAEFGREVGKRVPGLSREAIGYLTTRPWLGNVRELQNAIERAVIVSAGSLLTSADFRSLDAEIAEIEGDGHRLAWQLPPGGIDLAELNRSLIAAALARKHYNVSAAARLLGLTRPALRYRMKKYGLAS
jgi:two-component system NtrC family response regulator